MLAFLLNEPIIRLLLLLTPVATIVVAAVAYAVLRPRLEREGAPAAALGLLRRRTGALAASGLLVFAGWHAYEAIMNRMGFSSVAGLAICAGLFVLAGGALGWFAAGKPTPPPPQEPAPK